MMLKSRSLDKNKIRGFRRVDPTKPPVNKKSDSKAPKSPTKTYPSAATNPLPNGPKPSHSNDVPNSAGNEIDNSSVLKGQYCHYFVNKGYCRFEERTGTKCRFEHLQAPMCSFGTSCNRFKCMYSHPKVPSSQNNRVRTNDAPLEHDKAGEGFIYAMYIYMSHLMNNKLVPDTYDYTTLFGLWKRKGSKLDLNMARYIHGKELDTKLLEALVS